MDYQVFLSYRRSNGGEYLAGRLADKLKDKGLTVFYDIESMRSGTFNNQLYKAIDSCRDFLLVLPEGALDRCQNEDDWVRLEIAYALKKNKNVVPVMMNGFQFPDNLPADIQNVQYMQGVTASSEYFDAVVDKIVGLLVCKPRPAKQTKKCPVCNADNEVKNKVCAVCGESFVKPKKQKKPIIVWKPQKKQPQQSSTARAISKFIIVDVIIAVLVLGAWFGFGLPYLKKYVNSLPVNSETAESVESIENGVPQEAEIARIDGSSFSGSIYEEEQVDKYIFDARVSGKYNFSFDLSDANTDIRFHIYDKKNKDLSGSRYSDGKYCIVELESGESYEIHLSQDESFADYTVNIGIPNPVQSITGDTVSGSIDFIGKTDTYTFTPSISGMHNFAFTLSDATMSGKFSIYNSKNACVTDGNFSDGDNFSAELESEQTYTVCISYKSGFADYGIAISRPNPIKTVSGNVISGNLSYPKQTDSYLYTAPITGRYNLDFNLGGNASMSFSVLGANGSSVFSRDVKDGNYTLELVQGNTYTMSAKYKNSNVGYNLTVTVPNAVRPIINNSLSGTFDFDYQINDYIYVATESGLYGFTVTNDSHLEFYVLDENGNTVLSNSYCTNSSGSAQLTGGKQYTVRFIQDGGSSYSLKITPPVPVYTFNSGTMNGNLAYKDQCNTYHFVPDDEGDYTFFISCPDMRTRFSVKDNTGKELYGSVPYGSASKTLHLDKSRTYILTVTQYSSYGDYSIWVE